MSHNKVEVGRGGPLKRVGEIGWTVSQLDIGLVGRCRSWTLDWLDGVAVGHWMGWTVSHLGGWTVSQLEGVAVGFWKGWIISCLPNMNVFFFLVDYAKTTQPMLLPIFTGVYFAEP